MLTVGTDNKASFEEIPLASNSLVVLALVLLVVLVLALWLVASGSSSSAKSSALLSISPSSSARLSGRGEQASRPRKPSSQARSKKRGRSTRPEPPIPRFLPCSCLPGSPLSSSPPRGLPSFQVGQKLAYYTIKLFGSSIHSAKIRVLMLILW